MRIKMLMVWTLWSFFAQQTVDCITIRPSEISITTSRPKVLALLKSNKTIVGEVQITSDSRVRRLVPYMSFYQPGHEYNHQANYLPVHPSVGLRKRPTQSNTFPSIAYLYGGSPKYQVQRPNVQAGFIYKARDPYKPFSHIPVQPQMQPSYNSYKYQPLSNDFRPSVQHNAVVISEKNQFNPFSEANKLPGDFMPIFHQKNLPYKSYDDSYHSKIVSPPDQSKQPIRYSTPSPVVVTTESPKDYPSYEYQEIEIHPPTSPAPEIQTVQVTTPAGPHYQSVKVTTYVPDEEYHEKIKASNVQRFNEQTSSELQKNSIPEILSKLQESNHLPATLTPDHVDNSIKTLVKILNNMKQKDIIHKPLPLPPKFSNHADDDYDYGNGDYDDAIQDGSPGPNTGRPGIDYPNFHDIPETAFSCKNQRYKGFFGDPETSCQVWHYCDLNGGKASFLCPNGTIFSQVALTCDWWFNVKCSSTPQLYVLNERLYKFILPFKPKFPEDYSGPLVDKYLAIKFQEMEEKLRKEKEEKEEEAAGKLTTEEGDDHNEVDEVHSEPDEKRSAQDTIAYTPGLIRVPTSTSEKPVTEVVSELPPVPQTVFEQERLDMIEINNDGTSGHLTHSLE